VALSWVVLSSMGRSLWFDEAFSVWAARHDVAGVIASARADTWPPLYHLGLHGWTLIFGSSEWGVRSFSLLAYLLGALVLYRLGLEVGRSRTAAAVAVLAFATNSVLLKQAVTARGYPLLVLFAASSVLFFVKAFVSPGASGRWGPLALFVIANALGTFTHYWFFFLLAGVGVAGLVQVPRIPRLRFVLAMAVSVIPFAVLWTPALIAQLPVTAPLAWVHRPGVPDLIGALLRLLCGPFALPLLVALVLVRVRPLRIDAGPFRRAWQRPVFRTLVLGSAVAVLLPFLVSQVRPIFSPLYAVVTLPLLACAVAVVLEEASGIRPLVGGAVLVAVLAGQQLQSHGDSGWTDRSVARHLVEKIGDRAVLVFSSGWGLGVEYYLDRIPETVRWERRHFPADALSHPGWIDQDRELARGGELDREADALCEEVVQLLKAQPESKAYLFFNPESRVDPVLRGKLAGRLRMVDREQVPGNRIKVESYGLRP
jgi:hypothetical protein